MLRNLCPVWTDVIGEQVCKKYMVELLEYVKHEDANHEVFPPYDQRFKAFELVPFNKISSVIIGMDPYQNKGLAMGLSFSVPKGVKIPPSLRNIYKELNRDVNIDIPKHGDLTSWASQSNILMINSSLTVREGESGSHSRKGWEIFTSEILKEISTRLENVVFFAWGNHAKKCVSDIDTSRHLVLKSSHPSPLGCRHGFDGCGHFSLANKYLSNFGKSTINWNSINE